jgi:hypothetical protein
MTKGVIVGIRFTKGAYEDIGGTKTEDGLDTKLVTIKEIPSQTDKEETIS